ncbi:MAG: homoaconitase [Candidatus Latescibacterota bacterium]|nr:MAG: homoaconitase [Candidatus Latescibacterota bacterium]
MGQTVVEKIAQAHMTEGPKRPLRAGDVVSLKPRHVMTHDNTAAVMTKFRAIGAAHIHDPRQPVFPIDHDIQNTSDANLAKYKSIEEFAREEGVDFHPPGTGISHQVMVSQGYVVPGSLVVGSDSHSNMYGALSALGTPVVRTDAAAIWATGEFWWQIPRTVQVSLEGKLRGGVTGKDVIVTLCGLYNQGEVLNAAVEFTGPGVAGLSMDARMTIANMTTEWGALTGWFPVDDVTLDYLERRKAVIEKDGITRITEDDLEKWRKAPPQPDVDASYTARITVNLAEISPHVSGPDTVQVMRSLADIEKDRIRVHKAYLVSCVNSRLEDIESAAAVVKGKKIADGVEFYVAAASKEIQEAAESSGAWGALLEAGARPLPPGCGPCIGLGAGLLEPGEVGISATNRNFKGRMGSRDAQAYLGSPQVVAASAVAGHITGPEPSDGLKPARTFEVVEAGAPPEGESVEIQEGFPAKIKGRLVLVPQDNLNTDGIYGKDYTYREGMTKEQMAKVVMENYDPEFAAKTREGDVLVGGWNFGTGSSREQAATALQAKGIALVIAGSFSQTYLRNAYNNGFVCIDCSELVTRLREQLKEQIEAGSPTIIPGDLLDIDFANGTVTHRGKVFRISPLGSVPQSLVVEGGIENLVRKRLGLD